MLFALTVVHVLISLAGIASGFLFALDLLASRQRETLTKFFFWTTLATSLTGFLFPFERILPGHVFGVISVGVLAAAYRAQTRLAQPAWRRTYVVTLLLAQYLNVFILIVQMFLKIPVLHALAPTQTEPAFGIAQGLNLIGFLALGYLAVKRFRPVAIAA